MEQELQEKESNWFKENKEIRRLDIESIEIKHKFKMEELRFDRETKKLEHEWILERGRILRAEQRKMLAQKIADKRANENT